MLGAIVTDSGDYDMEIFWRAIVLPTTLYEESSSIIIPLYIWQNGAWERINDVPGLGLSAPMPSTVRFDADIKTVLLSFPGGAVVENLPANAGDTGSSPGLGRSHMPRSN